MNWRRGVMRVWVVGAALWAAVMLVQILISPPRSPQEGGGGHAFQAGDFVWSILMIAVPPLAVLVAGLLVVGAARFIIRGFRHD